MSAATTYQRPYLALVQDEPQAARLLTRMLLAHGAPSVRCLDGADQARTELADLLAADLHLPELVIVDLRVSPAATATFIESLRGVPYGHTLAIAAITPTSERRSHEVQLAAGADVVFELGTEDVDHRRVAARLVRHWVRSQRLDAVGA